LDTRIEDKSTTATLTGSPPVHIGWQRPAVRRPEMPGDSPGPVNSVQASAAELRLGSVDEGMVPRVHPHGRVPDPDPGLSLYPFRTAVKRPTQTPLPTRAPRLSVG
jgi:hypothetical protein